MPDTPIRIAINGFGRIGRTLLRILLREGADFELVAINDIEPLQTCAYLFQYDSVFGPWPEEVRAEDGMLIVGARRIPFHAARDLRDLDLKGVDIVLECTGMGGTRAMAERGLEAGARKVLVSGPSAEADITLVMGANQGDLSDHRVVSNASCTTNALAPLARVLDEAYGLISGQMTTVHCYTGSQPTVDKPRAAPERSRAAALSMVPTTTSATQLIRRVLPDLKGQLTSASVRVPVASVSAVDMTATLETDVTVASLNALLQTAAPAIIGHTDQPLVSCDLRGRPESLILALPETMVTTRRQVRLFGWYDNEWGFSARMIDMTLRMAARPAAP